MAELTGAEKYEAIERALREAHEQGRREGFQEGRSKALLEAGADAVMWRARCGVLIDRLGS